MHINFNIKGSRVNAMSSLLALFLVLAMLASCSSPSSEEYLTQAQENIDKQEFQTAIINLKNAIQKDPQNSQARFLLGKTYVAIGNGVSAEKELKMAQRLNFSSERIVVPLAQAYLLQGKAKVLLDELKPETDYSRKTRAEIFVARARAQLILGKEKIAGKLVKSALQEDPESVSALTVKARLAIRQGDLAMSQQLVEKVTAKQPKNIEAWLVMGEIGRLKGDLDLAKKGYNKVLTLDRKNIPALLGMAGIDIKVGDLQGALDKAKKIQSRSPNHPLANYIRAMVLYQQKNIEGAEQALQSVLKVAPEHLPSLQMIGAIHFSSGRYEQARVSLEKVLAASPNDLAVAKLLASTWMKLGRPESAIKVLKELLPANENDAQLLALLGSAYMQDKNMEKGAEYLDRAVALSPGNAKIQTQLALGRLASGNTDKAVEALEAAVELGQDVFQADILLALTHLRNKDFEKALEVADHLAKKLPKSAVPWNLAGAAFMGLGDIQAARTSFEKALTVQPDYSPAAINLATLDEKEGDFQSAKDRLEQVAKNKNIKAMLELARIASLEGRRAESEKWLNKAWEQNVGDLHVGTFLVRYWIKRSEFTKAIDISKEMLAQHPKDFAALRAYGLAQLAAERKNDAVETFSDLVDQYPDVAAAHYLLGKAYIAAGGLNAAERHFNKALLLDQQFLPAQLALAQLAVKNGNFAKAVQVAHTIQKQRPSFAIGYELEGDTKMHAKDPVSAAKVYAKGFSMAPSGSLAVKYFQAERRYRHKKADKNLLVKWLHDHPNDVRVRMVLAQAYSESENIKNAISQYQRILEISPRDVGALNNLAWLYFEMDRKDAVSYGKKAYDLAPNNPAVLDTYGWLLVKSGKSKQGLEYLQQAFKKAPEVADIWFHYAVALEHNGKRQEAREELRKLLEKHPDFSAAEAARSMLSDMH